MRISSWLFMSLVSPLALAACGDTPAPTDADVSMTEDTDAPPMDAAGSDVAPGDTAELDVEPPQDTAPPAPTCTDGLKNGD